MKALQSFETSLTKPPRLSLLVGRPLTAEVRVRSRASPSRICGWDRFLAESFGFPLPVSFHQYYIFVLKLIPFLRTAPFWAITLQAVVIPYRRFETTYRPPSTASRVQFPSTSRRKPEITEYYF
jgi:hypothetical protein